MPLPPQQEFTLENAAHYLKTSVPHVEEMVSTSKFTHITVKGEDIRHVYFDPDLCRQHRPKQPVLLTEHKDRLIAQWQALKEKPDNTVNEVFRKAAQSEIDRIQKDIPEDHTSWRIGPNEFAYLWQPSETSKKWKRPPDGIICIPRVALEMVMKKYGVQNEPNAEKAKKQEKAPPPNLSKLVLDEWYPVHRAAWWMSMHPEYLRGDLIPNRKLKAQKRGKRNYVQGHEIMRYLNQYGHPS